VKDKTKEKQEKRPKKKLFFLWVWFFCGFFEVKFGEAGCS